MPDTMFIGIVGTTRPTPHILPIYVDRGVSLYSYISYSVPVPVPPDTVILPDRIGSLFLDFYGRYYLRVWAFPTAIAFNNPKLGSEFEIALWNAYDSANSLIDIDTSAVVGIEYDFSTPLPFKMYESKLLTFNIALDAPPAIDGNLVINFDRGAASIPIIASLIEILQAQPEIPVIEVWEYNTAISKSYDGTEQRMCLRDMPKMLMTFTMLLENNIERTDWLRNFISYTGRTVTVPLYQYGTYLTGDAPINSTVLPVNTSSSKFNIGEYAVLYNVYSNEQYIYKIVDVLSDSIVIDVSTDSPFNKSWLITPCVDMAVVDNGALVMQAIAGEVDVSLFTPDSFNIMRQDIVRSGSLYDGLFLVDRHPIADEGINEVITTGVTLLDTGTSKISQVVYANTATITRDNRYKVPRGAAVDFWRELSDTVKGSFKPMLVPTYRNDLPLKAQPLLGAQAFTTTNDYYADMHTKPMYRRLMLSTNIGTLYVKATTIDVNTDGSLTVNIDRLLPTNPDFIITAISLVLPCRIVDDKITLTHGMLDTVVEFKTITVNI